ncbi:MAG: strawberry notch family protein, partial [Victivallales bacterium]|nr:strawberry notch family protein [Victivallales bacterium]
TPSKHKPTEQAAEPTTTQEKPQAAKPTTQAATPAPAAETASSPAKPSADAEEDAIMADIMADLKAFSDAGKGLHMNLFGFNDGQIAALTKLLWHGAQLGFHYIQKGIRTFADWLDAMDKKLHAAFKAYGLSEDNINEFYQDVWNTQYTHDGQRHTLAMWASELGQTREVQAGEATGELNVRYQPASNSKPLDTVAPKYLADAMAASLNRLQDKVGNLDQYVMEQLGYDSLDELYDKLAGEQVDGVAMAINAMSNGDGFILGDQTGIGKGRQCAAVMRWAIRNGKIPILVTERSNLFTDMYRDGLDVGIDFNPVIFAGSAEGNILDKDGQVVRRAMNARTRMDSINNLVAGGNDHNAVFLTYSQVSMPNAQRRELGELVEARNCILILDEAHNAAGDSNRGRYFMDFLRNDRMPVLYASATFAKRPDNMPIYFRTSLRKAVDNIEALPIAIRLGGVPLQQVVSRQLAEDGLFIRRERDFSGVEFENVSEEPPNYPEILANHDRTVKVLEEMVEFSNLIRAIIAKQNKDARAHTREAAAIVSTPFSSVSHNYIAQLLLASKIDLVVERAIKAFKANEKPVIALTSTIESAIENYMHDNGVQTGDRADMTYADILFAALQRMRRVTQRSGRGVDQQLELDFQEMGIQGQYMTLVNHIRGLADIKYPVSPIDYMRYKLTQAGLKVGEITGRTGGVDYSGKVPVFYSRNAEDKSKNGNINGFNNGTLDCLILNQSGSTG